MIPYGRQEVTDEDIQYVVSVLKSDFLTQGPLVNKFEDKLSLITQGKYVTAVNSATSALHIACLALDVGKDDWVWTVPNTFVASANCALYCGANIDFVDIDPNTHNISIDLLSDKLDFASKVGQLPKVVIPVHIGGEPCDMRRIKELSDQYGFKIIEDASHAIGGEYAHKPIGSNLYSDITIFSFHPVKIITSGEGGAALTNDKSIDTRLKLFRSHGITRDKNLMVNPNDDSWYYEQLELGFNYRISDIHAALGISQLDRLKDYVVRRHNVAKMYDEAFKNSSVKIPVREVKNKSALHLYIINVDESQHSSLFKFLRSSGVGVNLHYIPVHTQPYYLKRGFQWGDFPNSEKYYRRAISLPIYPKLSGKDQHYVIEKIKNYFDQL